MLNANDHIPLVLRLVSAESAAYSEGCREVVLEDGCEQSSSAYVWCTLCGVNDVLVYVL